MLREESGLQDYIKEVNKSSFLSPVETSDLALKLRRGNKKVRDRFIRANLRLVISLALKYGNRGLALTDLIGEGNVGLLLAVDRFNPRKGRFSTYAAWWIKQRILGALRSDVKTVRVPNDIRAIIAKWNNLTAGLSQQLGRAPHFDETTKELKVSLARSRLFRYAMTSGLPATKQVSLDLIKDVIGGLADERVKSVDQTCVTKAESAKINQLLRRLSPRETTILRMRYGLAAEPKPPMTLVKIGQRLKLSHERIRQIEKQALEKLATWLRRDVKGYPEWGNSGKTVSG